MMGPEERGDYHAQYWEWLNMERHLHALGRVPDIRLIRIESIQDSDIVGE